MLLLLEAILAYAICGIGKCVLVQALQFDLFLICLLKSEDTLFGVRELGLELKG